MRDSLKVRRSDLQASTRALLESALEVFLEVGYADEAAAHDMSFVYDMNSVFVRRMSTFRENGSLRSDCNLEVLSEALTMHSFVRSVILPVAWG